MRWASVTMLEDACVPLVVVEILLINFILYITVKSTLSTYHDRIYQSKIYLCLFIFHTVYCAKIICFPPMIFQARVYSAVSQRQYFRRRLKSHEASSSMGMKILQWCLWCSTCQPNQVPFFNFSCVRGLSLVAASRNYALVVVHGLFTAVGPLVAEQGF